MSPILPPKLVEPGAASPHRIHGRRFTKYVFVGVLNTVVGYGSFVALILVGVQYILALSLAVVLSVAHGYAWNRYFTFRHVGANAQPIVKFLSVYLVQYVFGLVGLVALVEIGRMHPIPAQAIIFGISVIFTYLAHAYWTFSSPGVGELAKPK